MGGNCEVRCGRRHERERESGRARESFHESSIKVVNDDRYHDIHFNAKMKESDIQSLHGNVFGRILGFARYCMKMWKQLYQSLACEHLSNSHTRYYLVADIK